jgi:hypothetical protein
VANLTVPRAALARGVATVEPIALLVERGPLGLVRAWLATAEAAGATSLADRWASGAPSPPDVAAAVAAIRAMHDRGVDHRDLNLGNVLVGADGAALVIDLDRARLHPGPLAFGPRARALSRLERSSVKLLGPAPRAAGRDLRRLWYEAYAGADAALALRLDRARVRSGWRIALHAFGLRTR